MREYYENTIKSLKSDLKTVENQFNSCSSVSTESKILDALITRMRAIEMMLDSVYIQAKANKILLN